MEALTVVFTCFLAVLVYGLTFFFRFIRFRRRLSAAVKDVPPVFPPHPIWGNVSKDITMRKAHQDLFDAMQRTGCKMYSFWRMFILPIVYTVHPDTAKNKMEMESKTGKSIEVFQPMGLVTLDTMLRCTLSYEGNIQSEGNTHPYVQAVKNLAAGADYRTIRLYLAPLCFFKMTKVGKQFVKDSYYVHSFAENIIKHRREKLKTDPDILKRRFLDFLDILIIARDEEGLGLTDREIRDEVDTFLFEGHDTTSSALSWSLYCLGQHQEDQERVYKEVQNLFSNEEELTWNVLHSMPLMTAFIKEVMRLYPPVPGHTRILSEDVEVDGVQLCEGLQVAINTRHIHRNPDVWPKCDEFIMDRFLESDKLRDPYSYVPFSAGPRNCIGQHFAMDEMKVFLATVLKRILPDPNHEPQPYPELILRSSNGIRVFFRNR